ncbi:uncharacterized protein EDB93DRAFT_1105298 [Suillus bovinus]|uniref:uncharacterized protein n=1 Tax=Suillus bovinus TaxID=48563 RepID=UPI001B85EBB1|nr:uncharacterized protein EDB93DRAFT_1105298 [Suillus bovinus]KAG2143459.1 hypothetical protein EDB93DRAFT_1105298 [Suillus bovinus]
MELEEGMIPVINGLEEPVRSQMENADSPIAVTEEDVEELIKNPTAQTKVELNESIAYVCTGLREGFWLFSNTHLEEWPLIYDILDRPPKTKAKRKFLQAQIDKEVEVEWYFPPFGPDLLPGMYSMPIYTVPKPGTMKH